jgi:hypothetical protein
LAACKKAAEKGFCTPSIEKNDWDGGCAAIPLSRYKVYYSNDKELNKVITGEVKSGARYVSGKKHGKLFLAGGGLLVFSRTPSDRRAFRNVKAELSRLLRQQAEV